MESDLGKLFIGGISWDTDEERLKKYFGNYGEVAEVVIMRDRSTGRARGFGFVVFSDPAVAERVILDKHMIDGRTVEAKKAVPRDTQRSSNRTSAGVHGSPGPGPGRTKKIFIGGLPSTITETDFKNYFDQFGTITDVVVMYDHNTQRPRGFGFITFDSEEAVDRVLFKTFHELNGKTVEVKRAVPKEHSPGPNRSPLIGYNYGLNRASNYLGNLAPGCYNMSPVTGYGLRMDGRFNSLTGGQAFSPFGTSGYRMGVNLEAGLSSSYHGASNFGSSPGYGRRYSPFGGGNSGRYTTPIGYNGSNARNDTLLSSTTRNVWGNVGFNDANSPSNPGTYLRSANGPLGFSIGSAGVNWGPSGAMQGGNNVSGYRVGNAIYGTGDGNYSLGGGEFGRNSGTSATADSTFTPTGGYEGSYGDLYPHESGYVDSTWGGSATPELDGSDSFVYGLSGIASDSKAKNSEGLIGSYNFASRQPNQGIAT